MVIRGRDHSVGHLGCAAASGKRSSYRSPSGGVSSWALEATSFAPGSSPDDAW